ncbi:MAG: hypothetical protein AAF560_11330, partial [Acidobacteriota bacterium]
IVNDMSEVNIDAALATPADFAAINEAMPRAFWLDCLRVLRREREAKPRASSTQEITTPPEPEGWN